MADIAPMLGAILGISKTPKGQDKKRAVKPTAKVNKKKGTEVFKTTHGEGSVTEQGQQHGELASNKEPTEKQRTKEEMKHKMRNATESWVSGHMTTAEHSAVHARAKHVLSAKPVREFKGKNGEHAFSKMRVK